jgi:hypothetical protein
VKTLQRLVARNGTVDPLLSRSESAVLRARQLWMTNQQTRARTDVLLARARALTESSARIRAAAAE